MSCASIVKFKLLYALGGVFVFVPSGEDIITEGVASPSGAADDSSQPQDTASNAWDLLTTESWQPGRVGEFNTTNPMKDLECEGPKTRIVSDSLLSWAVVKSRLQEYVAQNPPLSPTQDPWLLNVAMRIQRNEPDECVLGITATSSFLLPVTMPKFRNMARILSSDQDLMVLNVTFYDTLRSGFPVFGILDSLATPEYRAWFHTEESRNYFPDRKPSPACEVPAAKALRAEIEKGRSSWKRTPLLPSTALLMDGGGTTGCPLAAAAALIICALVRAEGGLPSASARSEALRDIVELVSRAEELVRDQIGEAMLATGELVATPWNIWWLLHRLQLVLPRFFDDSWRRALGASPATTADISLNVDRAEL